MPDAWVLDTSALFTLKNDEPGAETVEQILRDAGPKGRVHISFMTVMEFVYIVHQGCGSAQAHRAALELKQLPLRIVESDKELGLAAARLKAASKLSVTDAWIAATAERLRAILIHKDPDYEQVKDRIQLRPLPYKAGLT